MDRKNLFKISGLLIFFIFVIDFLADNFFWYYSIWYFDMIMHFLGGVWLGVVGVYLFTREALPSHPILKILFFVLVMGFGWEVFEFLFNNYLAQSPFNLGDSLSDIFFDLSGGVFAILYFLLPLRRGSA